MLYIIVADLNYFDALSFNRFVHCLRVNSEILSCPGTDLQAKPGEVSARAAVRDLAQWQYTARRARKPRGETGAHLQLAIKYCFTGNGLVKYHVVGDGGKTVMRLEKRKMYEARKEDNDRQGSVHLATSNNGIS